VAKSETGDIDCPIFLSSIFSVQFVALIPGPSGPIRAYPRHPRFHFHTKKRRDGWVL